MVTKYSESRTSSRRPCLASSPCKHLLASQGAQQGLTSMCQQNRLSSHSPLVQTKGYRSGGGIVEPLTHWPPPDHASAATRQLPAIACWIINRDKSGAIDLSNGPLDRGLQVWGLLTRRFLTQGLNPPEKPELCTALSLQCEQQPQP